MKIFVINLKRSIERRVKIERQLKRLKLDYEISEGIDGYKLTEEEINKYMDREHPYYRELTRGEIGCFLSHYSVLKKIADLKLSSAIVMEDDIIISKNFPALIADVEKVIQSTDTFLFYTVIILHPVNLIFQRRINDKYVLAEADTYRWLFGMQCYAVGQQAASDISANLLPVNSVVDNWLRYVENGYIKNLKVIFPFSIKPASTISEINPDIGNTRFAWIKALIYKHKIFPFWQIFMYRRGRYLKGNADLINVDGKQVASKFL